MKKVVTRIRRQYFDAIKVGTKSDEIRKLTEYWRKRFCVPPEDVPGILVLLCGKDMYGCRITGHTIVRSYPELINILGREPSEQGRKDIGTEPPWLAMHLGAAVNNEVDYLKVICQICGKTDVIDVNRPMGHHPRWEEYPLAVFGLSEGNIYADYNVWVCPDCHEKAIDHWDCGVDEETGGKYEVPEFDWDRLSEMVKKSLKGGGKK